MIEKPNDEQHISKRDWRKWATIISAVILCVGILTFLILKQINGYQTDTRENIPAQNPVEARSIEGLKTSAFDKLKKGDQKGGLSDLQSALIKAKNSNNASEVKYLDQQIDFAQNTKFTEQNKSVAPAPTSSQKNDPNMIVQ